MVYTYNDFTGYVNKDSTKSRNYPDMWILTIRSPKTVPRDYFLKLGKNTIGRHSDNDIQILDEMASRQHAVIECLDDRAIIRDVGSTNGTYVNQKLLVEPQELTTGDQIRIGFHLVSVTRRGVDKPLEDEASTYVTQPLTPEFLLESFDQNAVLIYEVANRLSTVLDIDKALYEIANFLKTGIGAEICHILLAEQFGDLKKLGFSESIARTAIEQHSVVVFPDPEKPTSPSESALFLKIRSALCIPIINDKDTIALVYAYKTDPASRPFDQKDIQLGVAVSMQVALAIQRNQILEKARVLEQWALTDSLTGLDNRRHLLKKAEMEFVRSKRFNHDLTCIIMDIDDFKVVNDTYGHNIGDQVIRGIGQRCKSQLRSVDIIGRYGGDEFLIFLVETDYPKTVEIAQRLRTCVAEEPIDTDQGPMDVTISMGLATKKEGCANAEEMINQADQALLVVKKAGKNQIG